MITKFLLNLSAGKISLERMSGGGIWVYLGAVKADDPHLNESLAKLRILAQPDLTGPFEVMVALPMDQVKTLNFGKLDLTRAEVVTALKGQTPYDVSELCVDWINIKGGSAIATVARDTLKDVADFTQQFNFNATMFVALPGGSWKNDFAIFDLIKSPMNEISLRLPPYITATDSEKSSELDYILSIEADQNLAKTTNHHETQAYSKEKPLAEAISVEVASRTLGSIPQPHKSMRTSPSISLSSSQVASPVHSGTPKITRVLKSIPDTTAQNTKKLQTSPVRQQTPLTSKQKSFLELVFKMSKYKKFKTKKVIPARKSIKTLQRQVGGKPRYLGVILTMLLVTFMLTVAALAETDSQKVPDLIPDHISPKLLSMISTVGANKDTIPDETLKTIQIRHVVSKTFEIATKDYPKARPSFLEVQIRRNSLSKFLTDKFLPLRPVSRKTIPKRTFNMGVVPREKDAATSLRPKIRPNLNGITVETLATNVAIQLETRASTNTSEQRRIQAGTIKNILNLRTISLIGVSGTARSPNALVRMANGKVLKVTIGDRFNGGRVTNIQTTTLTYAKSGRSIILKMPHD